jgi:hypothetical protein
MFKFPTKLNWRMAELKINRPKVVCQSLSNERKCISEMCQEEMQTAESTDCINHFEILSAWWNDA